MARVIKAYAANASEGRGRLRAWRERFSSHPALPELLDSYFNRTKMVTNAPDEVAVLLPLSGSYAEAAKAIRDGIEAANNAQPVGGRSQLRFYDSSNSAQIRSVYQRAVSDGADMIIGPLTKNSVEQLARFAGQLSVPVLALNQATSVDIAGSRLFQFSLSPEDEARQVAERAWLDGHTSAAVLTPKGSWGQRTYSSFVQRYRQLGGRLVGHEVYDQKENDFSGPLIKLLTRGKIKRDERPEPKEVEFLFLVATPNLARQIRPQVQFHHTLELPVYATSHVYSGKRDAKLDQDLEGIRFPDIPWLLVPEGSDGLSQTHLARTIPKSAHQHRRLYAMGIDAYRLLPNLRRLHSSQLERVDGKTGILSMDGRNRVWRRLVWATIKQGVPEVTGYAPQVGGR